MDPEQRAEMLYPLPLAKRTLHRLQLPHTLRENLWLWDLALEYFNPLCPMVHPGDPPAMVEKTSSKIKRSPSGSQICSRWSQRQQPDLA
ncbi:hypothetical protein WISP_42450 [Willisornis vidua]|uniref:Uncharacterized protein n=1 Tax=Willisornis vidua TaxID=1566151 RepID=A0ABQ9DKT7_9PASS|nr:hypothetical protein WISP_42450 [Willisornis vidua]